jgi:hypothetical protein
VRLEGLSMKNSNDGIGNRNRDHLACRAGPQTRKTEPIGDHVLTELKVLKNKGNNKRAHAPEMFRRAEHFYI